MNYRHVLVFILLICSIHTFGQTDVDALRLSRLQVIGSGRTMGVGGAFGALGGDFTVLSTNPAGIATYRHSEISLTPAIAFNQTRSEFEGLESSRVQPYTNLSNIGLIFGNVSTQRDSKWKTKNFALGTNRLANYHQTFHFEGLSQGSITERFVDLANGLTPDQLGAFEEGLAYDAGLIYNGSSNTEYLTDADSSDFTYKSQDFEATGHTNEFVISFGGNYMHRLYLGATIGVPFIRYEQKRSYREVDEDDSILYFDQLSYTEQFLTSGIGINLKVGAILRVNQMIRLGAAIHTPTRMTLSDTYSAEMGSSLDTDLDDSLEIYGAESGFGAFEYGLRTPWRAIGSAALIFKKLGFITAEVEYVDYANARFNFRIDDDYENEVNDLIFDKYGQALNLRIGGEIALSKMRLRAGYAIYGSPFKTGVALHEAINTNLSVGAGYHGRNIFIDFAIVNSRSTEEYIAYVAPNSSPAVLNTTNYTNVVLTLGYKFD